MGKFTVENENIYEQLRYSESLHSGVPVTVTFKVCKAKCPALSAGTEKKLRKVPPPLMIPSNEEKLLLSYDVNNRSASEPCTPTIVFSRNSDIMYNDVSVRSLTMSRETIV